MFRVNNRQTRHNSDLSNTFAFIYHVIQSLHLHALLHSSKHLLRVGSSTWLIHFLDRFSPGGRIRKKSKWINYVFKDVKYYNVVPLSIQSVQISIKLFNVLNYDCLPVIVDPLSEREWSRLYANAEMVVATNK